MTLDDGMLYALIIGCETLFWMTLLAGLACRYLLHWRRVSGVLLLGVPLIDVALLALTVVDLRTGATATFAHGLATAYVGFTVAFGHMVVTWADQQFAHHVAGGPPPPKPPSHGWLRVIDDLKLWLRCLLAVGITYALLFALIAVVDQPDRLEALAIWFRLPLGSAFFWFIFGPLWSLVFFKRARPER